MASHISTLQGFGDLVQNVVWSYDGQLLGTACKDRKIRIFDPRANTVVMVSAGVKHRFHSNSSNYVNFCRRDKTLVVP